MKTAPTRLTYPSLDAAYDYFNAELFGGDLRSCLITMQRHKGAYGYFHGDRFADFADPNEVTDEIALNPATFGGRTPNAILSTLVHEMAHLWQHHHGTPSRGGYHNREWADKMLEIGLIPTNTGYPGGKQVGPSITHMIEDGGRFDRACRSFLRTSGPIFYQDRETAEQTATAKKKAASKTKFTCPGCELNAWAKPDARLKCGDCDREMEKEDESA